MLMLLSVDQTLSGKELHHPEPQFLCSLSGSEILNYLNTTWEVTKHANLQAPVSEIKIQWIAF